MRKYLLFCAVALFLGGCSDGGSSVDNPVLPSYSSSEIALIKSSNSDIELSSSSDEPISSTEETSSSMEKMPSSSSGEPISSTEETSSSMEKMPSSSSDEPISSTEGRSSSMEKMPSSSSGEPISSTEETSSSMEKMSSSSNDESSSSEYFKSNWNNLDKNVAYDTIIDSRDNQVYKVVTIGSQTWMAENLNYYDEQVADNAICLNNEPSNCEKYGRLYNLPITLNYDSLEIKPYDYLHSIDSMSVQGICPNGWRIPTLSEWRIVGAKWKSSTIGISILKGSGCYAENKTETSASIFWTVSATNELRYFYVAYFDVAHKYFYDNRLMSQSAFVSVRCIKDN